MRKPASNLQLSGVDFSPFIGGQFQVRERCLCETSPAKGGGIKDLRPSCRVTVLQGEISKVQVVGVRMIVHLNWWAKNEGCPRQLSPHWQECGGLLWYCDILGAKLSPAEDPLLLLVQLEFTDRQVIFFRKDYDGKNYGGLLPKGRVAASSAFSRL